MHTVSSKPNNKSGHSAQQTRGYAAHREAAAQRQADQSLAGRDIGELPEVADLERKEACRTDFRRFCETYFPEVYSLEWSDDHLRAIDRT